MGRDSPTCSHTHHSAGVLHRPDMRRMLQTSGAVSLEKERTSGNGADAGLTGEASNVVYLISPVSSIRAKAARFPT